MMNFLPYLERLRNELIGRKTPEEKRSLLEAEPAVKQLFSTSDFLQQMCKELSEEEQHLIRQLAILKQPIEAQQQTKEALRFFLDELLVVDRFYREIGGLIGYQVEVLQRLEEKKSANPPPIKYHSPVFDDLSSKTAEVSKAIEWGLAGLPFMAELYPLGGAADRLHLVEEKSGIELPAAKLRFAGRTLLETLIRDLQAREWLYFRAFGKQLLTPVALMTSLEKNNDFHVRQICEEHHWFGRPKELFRFFVQPLVPTVDHEGNWHKIGPLKFLLKPGGHGAIWKLAKDQGVFAWLKEKGRIKALVRQINNPAAGLDHGLLAFYGIGWKKKMSFGFASCQRRLSAAEGMNVLIENEEGKIVLTNVEYCDFAKFGIEDKPLRKGEPFSRFSSNTNILFIDLEEVRAAVDKCPFPGLLVNLKKGNFIDTNGERKETLFARLESTMQNIADIFKEPKGKKKVLRTKKTFVTYNHRHKTISVAKKAYVEGGSLQETPEACFYELLTAHQELLRECGFSLPQSSSIEEYLKAGPDFVFWYHPALGPLYSIIQQKIQKGSLSKGSELLLEIADVEIKHLHLDGSLQIQAERVIGLVDEQSVLHYTTEVGRVVLEDVFVVNQGVDWSQSSPFWKMDLQRKESMKIELKGYSEFDARGVSFSGSHHFKVDDGIRMVVRQKGKGLEIHREPILKKDGETNSPS